IRRLGDRAARELMLTGERFDAATALRVGMMHHVVPVAELDAKVSERVSALLAGAPHAQRRIKMLLELWSDSTWEAHRRAPPRESYLNVAALLTAAKVTRAEAIHPGYGFLAENAEFAAAVEGAGLAFIGPAADQIRALGDKRAARALAAKAGVPVVPGAEGDD